MYKMICIDIDGTLVKPDLTISQRVKEAIEKAKKKGVVVALSTGRMHNSALLYSDELGLQDPIVSSNGAFVSAKEGETIYYEENLPLKDILSIQGFFIFIMEEVQKFLCQVQIGCLETLIEE